MFAKLTCLHQADETGKSPVVFVHGFPDSPAIFADYYTLYRENGEVLRWWKPRRRRWMSVWQKRNSLITFTFATAEPARRVCGRGSAGRVPAGADGRVHAAGGGVV